MKYVKELRKAILSFSHHGKHQRKRLTFCNPVLQMHWGTIASRIPTELMVFIDENQTNRLRSLRPLLNAGSPPTKLQALRRELL
jgi:hypothetical protein